MTRMDCSEVRDLIQAFEDGELTPVERAAVADHLAGCDSCLAAQAGLAALRRNVKAAGTFALPPGLEDRVRHAIGIEREAAEPGWRRYGRLAASHAAAAVLGGVLAFGLIVREDGRTTAGREVVSAHVRSLLGEQLVQVASADTHTVRPWFTGKVPFAPAVPDLARLDFPLIGGRVDYLMERPAAALVYGRRKHRINVFVMPVDQIGAAPQLAASRNGYNLLAWQQGGFAYFAASDLNAVELGELAAALREHAPH